MKLDVNVLRYLSKDEFRVLTAVEMGMKNHELVPSELVDRIAGLRHGGAYKNMKTLLKHKLVHHDSTKYDGYRLTNLGYDYLAIKTMVNRGLITGVGRQIGVGKESDIFEVTGEDGGIMALKLHRLGRTSFRAVKSKRDYLKHRSSFNWLYLSRLAALKEYAFMKALGEKGFPVPKAIDCNRHCVLMSLVPGYPLVQVKALQNPVLVFQTVLDLIVRLAEHGLIHCDFNEFNLMVDDQENMTMIDFPQMVSVSHRNAQMYFDRDVECIYKFFGRRHNCPSAVTTGKGGADLTDDNDERPIFEAVKGHEGALDQELAASGFTKKAQEDLNEALYLTADTFAQSGFECDNSEDEVEAPGADNSTQSRPTNAVLHVNSNAVQSEIVCELSARVGQMGAANETHEITVESNVHCDGQDRQISEEYDIVPQLPELQNGLEKQRRLVVKAVQSKSRHWGTRNVSKDKGGKRSRNIISKGAMDY